MNFKKTFFSTVLLILCLFITEGATRILFHLLSWDIKAYQIDGGRYQAEPFRAYGLTPGWELKHESLKETYNSQGFKSPYFTIKKSDDIYRIVVLGGSSVYGNYGNDKTWSHFLNEYLVNPGTATENIISYIKSGPERSGQSSPTPAESRPQVGVWPTGPTGFLGGLRLRLLTCSCSCQLPTGPRKPSVTAKPITGLV